MSSQRERFLEAQQAIYGMGHDRYHMTPGYGRETSIDISLTTSCPEDRPSLLRSIGITTRIKDDTGTPVEFYSNELELDQHGDLAFRVSHHHVSRNPDTGGEQIIRLPKDTELAVESTLKAIEMAIEEFSEERKKENEFVFNMSEKAYNRARRSERRARYWIALGAVSFAGCVSTIYAAPISHDNKNHFTLGAIGSSLVAASAFMNRRQRRAEALKWAQGTSEYTLLNGLDTPAWVTQELDRQEPTRAEKLLKRNLAKLPLVKSPEV